MRQISVRHISIGSSWTRLIAGCLACSFLLLTAPNLAQETASSLPAELGWVRFRITAGRLQVASAQFRESRSYEAGNPLTGTAETMRLNVSAQSTSVSYRKTSPRSVVTVDFEAPSVVTIEVVPGEAAKDDAGENGHAVAMKYTQKRDGPIHLLVDDGKNTRTHEADSFWHLMLLAPADMQQHLLPVLDTLRAGWQIAENAQEIERSLIRLADSPIRPNRGRWAKLVEELGSSSFQKRRQAERLLRQSGPAVLAYLNSLPVESMDAERRARISRLLDALSSESDDTPDRIALWLIDDPIVWASVLESEEEAHRVIAKEQIETLLGRPIEFDPEGQHDHRSAQAQAIREQLGNR